jgi:hypothetical protein
VLEWIPASARPPLKRAWICGICSPRRFSRRTPARCSF